MKKSNEYNTDVMEISSKICVCFKVYETEMQRNSADCPKEGNKASKAWIVGSRRMW